MKLNGRFFLSTAADDAAHMAEAYHVALEIQYEDAAHMDAEKVDYWHSRMAGELPDRRNIVYVPLNPDSGADTAKTQRRSAQRLRLDQAFLIGRSHRAQHLCVSSGFVPGAQDVEVFLGRAAALMRAFMRNKPASLRVSIENVYEEDPMLLVRLVRAIGDPRVSLCLDVGHAYLHPRASLEEWIDSYAPYLTHVHLHDNDGVRDRHWPIGDGYIDYKRLLPRILQSAPAVTFTLETLLCKPSLQWLVHHGFIEKLERVTMHEHLYFGWL